MSDQKIDDIQDDDVYDDYDDSSLDGEWDEFEDEDDGDGEPSGEPPAKKKSSFSTILIIALVVVFGLGFVVYKFGSAPSQPQPAPEQSVPVANTGAEPATTGDAPMLPAPDGVVDGSGQVQDTPADFSQNGMAGEAGSGPLTPMPGDVDRSSVSANPVSSGDVSPDQADQDFPPLMTAIPDGEGGSPLDSSPADPDAKPEPLMDISANDSQGAPVFPSVDMIKKSDSPTGNPATPLIPQDVVRVIPDQETETTAEAAVSSGTPAVSAPVVDDLAQQKIESLKESLEKSQKAAVEYKGQVDDLKDEIAVLKAKLESRSKPVSNDPLESVSAEDVVAPVARAASPVSQTGSSGSNIKWTLRGAKSGQALIAKEGSANQDVRTVVVGDVVPGIGRILSIGQGQTGWVVLGTLGKVTE